MAFDIGFVARARRCAVVAQQRHQDDKFTRETIALADVLLKVGPTMPLHEFHTACVPFAEWFRHTAPLWRTDRAQP